jgi:YgiT-type zinc finger domain-containing protein
MKENSECKETMVDTGVTYTQEHGGKFFIVENVPARVCRETGEQYFAPDRLSEISLSPSFRHASGRNPGRCVAGFPPKTCGNDG